MLNGLVYVGSADGYYLYAINALTGVLKWKQLTGNAVESSPAVANGVVYVLSFDTKLYAFNAITGAPLPGNWPVATGIGQSASSPAVANGMVFVGSADGNIYAFEATRGYFLWAASTDGQDLLLFSGGSRRRRLYQLRGWQAACL